MFQPISKTSRFFLLVFRLFTNRLIQKLVFQWFNLSSKIENYPQVFSPSRKSSWKMHSNDSRKISRRRSRNYTKTYEDKVEAIFLDYFEMENRMLFVAFKLPGNRQRVCRCLLNRSFWKLRVLPRCDLYSSKILDFPGRNSDKSLLPGMAVRKLIGKSSKNCTWRPVRINCKFPSSSLVVSQLMLKLKNNNFN